MCPANVEMDLVRRYSRYARAVCTFFLVVLASAAFLVLRSKLSGTTTPGTKFWMVTSLADAALYFGFLVVLRRLFDSLAGGEIFSSRNVGHVRHSAYLFCAMAVFKLLVLIAYGTLTGAGIVEPSEPRLGRNEPEDEVLIDMFEAFMMAGILMLAAWIMQVGLGVRNEADELKRDAELVV